MFSVCKICLDSNTKLTLKNNLLKDIYEKLCNTKFNSEDAQPRAICCFCYQKLLKCYTFSQMACRSENILRNLIHHGLEASQEYLISEVSRGMNQPLSISVMQHVTIDDNATDAGSLVTIKNEPRPSTESKEDETTEQDELEEVELKNQLPLEADQRHDVEELLSNNIVEQTKPDDPEMIFSCNDCYKTFFLKSQLISHIKQLHSQNKGYLNSYNKQQVTNKSEDKIIPNGKKLFAYKECEKKIKLKYNYFRRQSYHTDKTWQTFACRVCDKQFHRKCELVRHMTIHPGEKPFACNICDKQFNRKSILTKHMRIHTEKKPFACHVCCKQFKSKGSVNTHMVTHTEEKPFACNLCDKRFKRKDHLIQHMNVHTGDKPFACNVCNRKFRTNGEAVSHMRIHTDEKQFACNICDRQFHFLGRFNEHMRIHTGEKLYVCNVCDKQFLKNYDLVRHMRTHTAVKPIACNVCT